MTSVCAEASVQDQQGLLRQQLEESEARLLQRAPDEAQRRLEWRNSLTLMSEMEPKIDVNRG